MFSNNIQGLIIFNIYVLIFINAGIFVTIYFLIFRTKIEQKRYGKTREQLETAIDNYIEQHSNLNNLNNLSNLNAKINSNYRKMVAIDIINEYSQNTNKDNSSIIEELKLDMFIFNKIKRRQNIKYLRKLAFMRVSSSYEVLIKYIDSEDLDIKYTCYFGLVMLNVEIEKKYYIIHKLVNSDLLRDRIIEILYRVDLEFDHWIELLEREVSEKGKVIFLNILTGKQELKSEKYSNRLIKFLKDTTEVKIAAITAICSSKNEKYIEDLYSMFKEEKQWEVRVAITKGMSNFDSTKTKDKLLYMIKDKEWWVRFNAAKAISLMGEEGVYTLIQLSIDKSDENVSALAYYFLNSNKDVYETVKNVEV